MKWYVCPMLLAIIAIPGRCDEAIAQGVARIALLSQGYDAGSILQPEDVAAGRSTQSDFESFYEKYNYDLTGTVFTSSGIVQGAKYPEAYTFYSIPYALPPARFQPPEMFNSDEPIDASKADGRVCEQLKKNCTNGVCIFNTNEDCLVLNVYVPGIVEFNETSAITQVRPVLVWFHGGGFFGGGGTIPEFEARWFSNITNAVVVTVNYRLGAFGFLVHGEGENAIKGNLGIQDQQLALQWVQNNIAQFGGDPNMVTIFGNSAGAQSVMFHLVSEVSKPLFQRAIMQSNPAVFQYHTPEEAKRVTNRLLRVLNCTGVSMEEERKCLVEAEPQVINVALIAVMALSLVEDSDIFSTVEAFRPVIDGTEFKKQPFEMFRDGTWNTDKDLIIGTNTEELETIQYYIPDQTPNGTPIPFPRAFFEAINNFLFGDETGQLVSDKYLTLVEDVIRPDYEVLLGIEASHMFFVCPSRLMARLAANTSSTGRVYLYSNSHPMDGPTCQDVVKPTGMCGMAFHGGEPPFVFRSGPFYGYDFRDVDTSAADQFDFYWTNFAVNGDPSNPNIPSGIGHDLGPFEEWPRYSFSENTQNKRLANHGRGSLVNRGRSSPGQWQNIQIGKENIVQEEYTEDFCDFWDSLNYYVTLSPTATDPPPNKTDPPTVTDAPTKTTSAPPSETDPPGVTDPPMETTSGASNMTQSWVSTLLLSLIGAKWVCGIGAD